MILHNHFIYFNLHKRCWSLKALQSDPSTGAVKGRVTTHAVTALLFGVTCKVSEAGRQRVIREKRKNVHAGLIAQTVIIDADVKPVIGRQLLSYNPYNAAHFYDRNNRNPVDRCNFALLYNGRVGYGDCIIHADDAQFTSYADFRSWQEDTGYAGIATCSDGAIWSADTGWRDQWDHADYLDFLINPSRYPAEFGQPAAIA